MVTSQVLMKYGAVFLVLLLQACASNNVDNKVPDAENIEAGEILRVKLGRKVDQPLMLIATDLVGALSQISQFDTETITIDMPVAMSYFGRAVRKALKSKGYDVREVRTNAAGNLLLTSVERKTSAETDDIFTYVIKVNDVALKRSYSIQNRVVVPVSSLYVRGASPRSIVLDDRIFVSEDYWRTSYKASDTSRQVAGNSSASEISGPDESYLCTPEGKGKNTDGWVCWKHKSGKQWIDASTRSSLLKSGMVAYSIQWDELNAMPDVEIIDVVSGVN